MDEIQRKEIKSYIDFYLSDGKSGRKKYLNSVLMGIPICLLFLVSLILFKESKLCIFLLFTSILASLVDIFFILKYAKKNKESVEEILEKIYNLLFNLNFTSNILHLEIKTLEKQLEFLDADLLVRNKIYSDDKEYKFYYLEASKLNEKSDNRGDIVVVFDGMVLITDKELKNYTRKNEFGDKNIYLIKNISPLLLPDDFTSDLEVNISSLMSKLKRRYNNFNSIIEELEK